MKDSRNNKEFGQVGLGLCALCCLLPIVSTTFGLSVLAVVSSHIAWIGIAAFIAGLGIYYLRKRKRMSCKNDCACK